MGKCVRGSAFALAAALIVAAACAASRPGGLLRFAKLAAAPVAADSILAATPAGDAPRERGVPGSTHGESAPFDLAACANGAAGDAAEFRPVCLDPPEFARPCLDCLPLEGSGAVLGASLGGPAAEVGDDPDSVYLTDLAPSATAAPTPEISTAAMLTLGFAGAAWTARRRRRPALALRLRPAIAAIR